MDAEGLSKLISQLLIDAGFKGIIPAAKAQELVKMVTSSFSRTNFNIIVELAPIHNVGKAIQCDCSKSKIIVKPKQVSAKRRTGLPSGPRGLR